jgi:hypothetical protein
MARLASLCIALFCLAAHAGQPATLRVVATKAPTQHEKLDQLLAGQKRLEQKLDALKVAPAPVVVEPPKPVDPPAPAEPVKPAVCPGGRVADEWAPEGWALEPDCRCLDRVTRGFAGNCYRRIGAAPETNTASTPSGGGVDQKCDASTEWIASGDLRPLTLRSGQVREMTWIQPAGTTRAYITTHPTPLCGVSSGHEQAVQLQAIDATGRVLADSGKMTLGGAILNVTGLTPLARYSVRITPIDLQAGASLQAHFYPH